jgi:hypothetical protein
MSLEQVIRNWRKRHCRSRVTVPSVLHCIHGERAGIGDGAIINSRPRFSIIH